MRHLTTLITEVSATVGLSSAQNLRLIFRGLSDATQRLVPTALRTEEEHKAAYDALWSISDSRGRPVASDARALEISQRRAELHVLQYFYQYVERAGLPLPPISNSHSREELLTGQSGNLDMAAASGQKIHPITKAMVPAEWPPRELLPLISLAQHYGLPTRLLDWSSIPFISGYFAAAGAVKRLQRGDDPDSFLTVWATIGNSFESYGQFDEMEAPASSFGIERFPARLVQPPSAENPNLSLQRGVFTVVMDDNKVESDQQTNRDELHDFLGDFQKSSKKPVTQKVPLFFSLHLPISESPKLLLSLQQLGYGANRIYDGYPGAAQAVHERAMLYGIFSAPST